MNNGKSRVAVLGGAGFVGRNVTDELEAAGLTVEVFSRTTGCDLIDLPTATHKLHSFRPDWIVNCAAKVGSINYVYDFAADVLDENLRIILNIYKIAQQMREVVLINPVANCAYPGAMDLYREDEFYNGPVHPSVLSYGTTRRAMPVFSQCYYQQYGVRSLNLIVPNMYGPHDSTNPNKTHALNALVIKFVRAVKHGQKQVEVWGTGNPIREWLFVKDFAGITRRVIECVDQSMEPVNIAQNHGYSVREIVDVVKELTGFDGEVSYNTRFQDGSAKKVMDDTRFKQRFPDAHFTDLRTGVQQTINYYRPIL